MIEISYESWKAKGTELFGAGFMKWRFACPVCKNVAAVEDFQKFSDRGASPNSATCECIGRYETERRRAFGPGPGSQQQPCDYAGYGLFRLSPIAVVHADGKRTDCFAFAEAAQAKAAAK